MNEDSRIIKEDKKDSEAVWDQYINEGSPVQTPVQTIDNSSNIDSKDLDSKDDLSSAVNTLESDKFEPDKFKPDKFETYKDDIIPEQDDIIDPVNLKLDDIQNQLNIIQKEFNQKIKFDAHKNKIIDNLHQELQEHKNDILKKYLKSVILDIIQFTDSLRKLSNFYNTQDPSEIDPEKLLNLLKHIPSDLEDICSKQGITPFTNEGADFNPSRQRVLKKIETQEKEKDKKVAESIHPGYEWDGIMIRPEMVAVYNYIKPLPDTEMRDSDE